MILKHFIKRDINYIWITNFAQIIKSSPHKVLQDLIQRQDEKSFDYLYEHYSGALYGVILKIVRQEYDAEEILQEAMVNIWKNLSTY